jgi:hypothetical protein
MDPNIFVGTMLSVLGAAIAAQPGHAGVVCDRRGFCVEQPQFQQPYYPPPPVYVPAPQPASPPPRPQADALGGKVKGEIYEFCGRNPSEQFCRDLERYLQQHPDAR